MYKIGETLVVQEEIVETSGLTRDKMIECYNTGDDIYGFIGGLEVDVGLLDNLIAVGIKPTIINEDGSKTRYTYEQVFPHVKSLSGDKAIIRIVTAVNGLTSWKSASPEVLNGFLAKFGVDSVMTKSECQTLLDSTAYKLEVELDEMV